MTEDDGRRVLAVQTDEQCSQTLTLSLGSCVTGFAVGVQSAFVADTDGVAVVTVTVCTLLPEGTTFVDLPVARDVVVIAYLAKASLEMVAPTCLEGIALFGPRGRTMQDDECDGTKHDRLKIEN